jgi:hypothetical protein
LRQFERLRADGARHRYCRAVVPAPLTGAAAGCRAPVYSNTNAAYNKFTATLPAAPCGGAISSNTVYDEAGAIAAGWQLSCGHSADLRRDGNAEILLVSGCGQPHGVSVRAGGHSRRQDGIWNLLQLKDAAVSRQQRCPAGIPLARRMRRNGRFDHRAVFNGRTWSIWRVERNTLTTEEPGFLPSRMQSC